MYSFVVLGIIPGTDIQITFLGWLVATMAMVIARYLLLMRQKHSLLWLQLILAFYAMQRRPLQA